VVTTGYDSAWNDKGTEYLLYVVDTRHGALRFKKPVKVKGRLKYITALKAGVLYVTSHEIDVLDPASGKTLNDGILRGKKPLVAASRGDGLYAFSTDRGLIYRVDYSSGRITPFSTQPVKLAGKDLAVALETRGSGLVLLGRQNVVAYGPDGSVKFERHHAAPKRHAVIQALLYAQAARGAMASFASGVYAAGFAAAAAETQDGSIERTVATSLSSGYSELGEGYAGLAGDYWAAARERFQASASARDFVFMMTRQDNRRIALAQVSKDTGEIAAFIDLGKDKEPNYQVDDIGNKVFYRTEPSVIVAYEF
jgi:hypothetical protein